MHQIRYNIKFEIECRLNNLSSPFVDLLLCPLCHGRRDGHPLYWLPSRAQVKVCVEVRVEVPHLDLSLLLTYSCVSIQRFIVAYAKSTRPCIRGILMHQRYSDLEPHHMLCCVAVGFCENRVREFSISGVARKSISHLQAFKRYLFTIQVGHPLLNSVV